MKRLTFQYILNRTKFAVLQCMYILKFLIISNFYILLSVIAVIEETFFGRVTGFRGQRFQKLYTKWLLFSMCSLCHEKISTEDVALRMYEVCL